MSSGFPRKFDWTAIRHDGLRWGILLVLSIPVALALEAMDVPAAMLLGPMLVAIVFGAMGVSLRVPRLAFWGSQSIIGCLVAQALTPAIVMTLLQDWLPMFGVVTVTVLASGIVGWLIGRFGRLPGTTAAWGSSPGAAAAMVAMAEEFGADVRLVAFMQYLRVVMVVLSASLVSRVLLGATAAPAATVAATASPGSAVVVTLVLATGGAALGRVLHIPSGAMLAPMVLAAILHSMGVVELALPPAVLAVAYTGLGWYVGLQFTRTVILYALKALPQLILAILLLMGLCGLSAWALVLLVGTTPLTAYLATSPGGLDSIAVIAVGSQADVPFVLALQTLRLFIVILTGPAIAKLISRML